MWRHIRQRHSAEIARFNLTEDAFARGESCIRRPPTPNLDIGSEPEYTLEEGDDAPNINNNAKDDSDAAASDEEQDQGPTSTKTKMDTANRVNKPVRSVAIKKFGMPNPPTTSS